VTQDEITDALVLFYKQRYIGLDEKIIREALEKSVSKLD
jgi:cell division septal protein FtsQ